VRDAAVNFGLDAGSLFVPFVAGAGTARRAANAVNAMEGITDAEKTYQVYGKIGEEGQIYIGRTSGFGSSEKNVARRDYSHHMSSKGYGPAQHLITVRSYDSVRGLEQLGQKYSQSLGRLADQIRGISPANPNLGAYLQAAQSQLKSLQEAINKLLK
jgi:hypothetical protein